MKAKIRVVNLQFLDFRKNLYKLFFISVVVAVPKIYSVEGYKTFFLWSIVGLMVLLIARGLSADKTDRWFLAVTFLSAPYIVLNGLKSSSVLWTLWIILICFVWLRKKLDLKLIRVLGINFVVFLMLSSAVELPLRLAESSSKHSDIHLGVEVDRKYFVELTDKSYYRKALETSRSNPALMSPNQEYLEVNENRIQIQDDLVFMNDFTGSYINVKLGKRVTVGSSGLRNKRVLVFGGSTIFSAEVPDAMTIPSQLQKIFGDNEIDYDILNFGIPGIRVENQLKILETIDDLGANDIVVFYDGVNDLNTIFRLGLESDKTLIPLGTIKKLFKWLDEHSLLARFLISGYIDSKGLDDEFLKSEAKKKVTELWINYAEESRQYVETKGARFVHILQPSWVTFKGGIDATRSNKRWSDMKVIQNYFEKSANSDMKIENFTKVLDGLSETPYIDWAHLDEIGNKKVAEEMFRVLKPLLEPASK